MRGARLPRGIESRRLHSTGQTAIMSEVCGLLWWSFLLPARIGGSPLTLWKPLSVVVWGHVSDENHQQKRKKETPTTSHLWIIKIIQPLAYRAHMILYVPNKLVGILFYYFLWLGWRGLVNACCREIATLTYRSGLEWARRFGRARLPDEPPSLCHNFEIEQYIEYQGLQHATKLDANTLLYISKVSTSPLPLRLVALPLRSVALPLRLVAQSRYRHSFTMSHCDYTRNSKQPTMIFFRLVKHLQFDKHLSICLIAF